MQVAEGWVRGKLCGKWASFTQGVWGCALCQRRSNEKDDVCFPVKEGKYEDQGNANQG